MTVVASRVVKARKELLGLKQRELADVLGLQDITISRWERGESQPDMENLRALAKIVGKPIGWFFEEPA